MPQAIEWSLATPKISARRPSSSPMRSSAPSSGAGCKSPCHLCARYHPVDDPEPAAERVPLEPGRRAARGAAASCSTSTAWSSWPAGRSPERPRRSTPSTSAGSRYRIVTNTSLMSRADAVRLGHPDRPVTCRPSRSCQPCPCRPPTPSVGTPACRSSCSPRTMPGPSSPASTCCPTRRPAEPDARAVGGRDRRFARSSDLRQPEPRLPARARRGRAGRHASQPVVADAGRPDARFGRVRGRPRVRHGRRATMSASLRRPSFGRPRPS